MAKNTNSTSNKVKVDGRGRPAIYTGNLGIAVKACIRKNGLTVARQVIANEGITVRTQPGKPSKTVKMLISMPTLGKLAKEANIKLYRGRPEKVAA